MPLCGHGCTLTEHCPRSTRVKPKNLISGGCPTNSAFFREASQPSPQLRRHHDVGRRVEPDAPGNEVGREVRLPLGVLQG